MAVCRNIVGLFHIFYWSDDNGVNCRLYGKASSLTCLPDNTLVLTAFPLIMLTELRLNMKKSSPYEHTYLTASSNEYLAMSLTGDYN